MAGLISITALGVRLFVTALFLFAGINKVTELSFVPGVYQEMTKKFICYGGWTGNPQLWQLAVGGIEIFLALFLWLHPGLSTLALLAIMGGAVGSHILCNEPYLNPLVPAGILVLHWILLRASSSSKTVAKKQKAK